MGRRTASATTLTPDPVYGSKLASKFINCLMHSGKKSVAQDVFYSALDVIKEKLPDKDPIEVFTTAVENVKPYIEVRSRRVGGAAASSPLDPSRPDGRPEAECDRPKRPLRSRRASRRSR